MCLFTTERVGIDFQGRASSIEHSSFPAMVPAWSLTELRFRAGGRGEASLKGGWYVSTDSFDDGGQGGSGLGKGFNTQQCHPGACEVLAMGQGCGHVGLCS